MPRGITLEIEAQVVYKSNLGSGYRNKITATNGTNIDNEIFRYTRTINDFQANTTTDVFEGICSPEQLESLPLNAPNPDDPNQYFRLAVIDLIFETRALADDGIAAIKSDVAKLIKAMNINDDLSEPSTVRIGDA